MANPGTMTPPAPSADNGRGRDGEDDAPSIVLPFTRAAHPHHEFAFDSGSIQLAAASRTLQEEIPPYGYLRWIDLIVELTGGAAGAAVVAAHEDAPWSVLEQVQLLDVDGTAIVDVDGYGLYLANKYGGYRHNSDPRARQSFSALDANGNGKFVLRVPVEAPGRDALCSLPNLTSEATFKVRAVIAGSAGVFDTAPDTLPAVTVKAYAAEWSQPTGQDPLTGLSTQTEPLASGSTQQWRHNDYNVRAGSQQLRLNNVGHSLRNLVWVARDAAGARSDVVVPLLTSIHFDTLLMEELPIDLVRDRMSDHYGYHGAPDALDGLDTGVYVWDRISDFDGQAGFELRDDWLVTSGSSRIELRGSFQAEGTLKLYTNDVIVKGELQV